MKGSRRPTSPPSPASSPGPPPSAAASTRAPIEPVFGIPQFFGIYSDYLSGVHVLVGLGIIMVIGGLLSFKWPSVGGVIVCVAAMVGLIYTYDRGQYRWTPYLYYWWAPVAARLDLRHLRRLRGLQERAGRTAPKLHDARHAEGYEV